MRRAVIRGLVSVAVLLLPAPSVSAQARTGEQWLALARSGFSVPAGDTASALLIELQPLLASPDPRLRDGVAYMAAEQWILRDRVIPPEEVRRLMHLWLRGLDVGLGTRGDDRVYGRTFSALCLALVAARDVATPFLTHEESRALLDRLLDYLSRERDLRGFDPVHGWIHAVAHTADGIKFLARGAHWRPADLAGVLTVIDAVNERHGAVFGWGEGERVAAALHAAVRRPDADTVAFDAWLTRWTARHTELWAAGPLVDTSRFAAVENTKQIVRAMSVLLALESAPSPSAEAARRACLTALARMR